MELLTDLASRRIGVLLNLESGGCDTQAEHALTGCLRSAGIEPAKVWCGGGADVESSLDLAMAEQLDVLVVLGGDGTIRAAAQKMGPGGPLLAPPAGWDHEYACGTRAIRRSAPTCGA